MGEKMIYSFQPNVKAVIYSPTVHKNWNGKDNTPIQLQNKAIVLDTQLLKFLKIGQSSNTFP